MRRLLKTIFSQVVIGSILMILQIFLIAASILRISEYLIYFDIFLRVLSVITVVIIINRHSNPMYKLAWVVPILLFPIFGGLFYLFITGQSHTKKFFNKLSEREKQIMSTTHQDNIITDDIAVIHPERISTVKFINNVSGSCVYRCEEAEYFPVGEDKFHSMLSELKQAEKYIFLEYFIIKPGKMWNTVLEILKQKAAEGVEVRLMYDGMGSMTSLPYGYPKELEKFGIKCKIFFPFTPFLSAMQNNRDHRKILVIDGKVAYTGGINLADEYINIGYEGGHWKDMSVMVKGEAAFSFTMMFLHLWDTISKTEDDIEKFKPDFSGSRKASLSKGYVMPYADMPQDKNQTGEFIYLDMINKARRYIHITTPYLILDHEMVVALTNAAKSGVDVKIICPLSIDHWYARSVAYSYYPELIEAGVKLYEYTPGFIHGKTFVADDEVCVVGSINLDYRSLYLHFECAAWFLDCHIVADVENDFTATLSKCREITVEECAERSTVRKIFSAVLRLFAPLM